jgi:hypothetical protein
MSNGIVSPNSQEDTRMSETAKVDLSPLSSFDPAFVDQWRSVSTLSHSVLLEGPEASTAALLLILEPRLRAPVIWKPARAPLELPTGECGALVLQGVAALSSEDQARLVEWLDRSSHRTQLISTSAHPLFKRVESGLFAPVLYYRLNVMLLHVKPNGDRRAHRPDAADLARRTSIQHDESGRAS